MSGALASFGLSVGAAERQLTHAPHGHVLTNSNVWPSDSRWIVYDVRTVDRVFAGTRIEQFEVATGRIQTLDETKKELPAVSCLSPAGTQDRVYPWTGDSDARVELRHDAAAMRPISQRFRCRLARPCGGSNLSERREFMAPVASQTRLVRPRFASLGQRVEDDFTT